MYKFYISLLFIIYSQLVFSEENSWGVEKLSFVTSEELTPSVLSDSKLSVAYLMRHPIKRDTKLYFMLPDTSCNKGLSMEAMHFVYINNEKGLFMSSCWDTSHRRLYSLSGGYLLLGEFLNKEMVSIREIEPTNGVSPINENYSTVNFEKVFHAYNKKAY